MKKEEFTLPMPWGQVAGVAWGEPSDPIVLCFHGLLDNAGSFTRLIQFLPNCFYYVCVDLPGHGRSDHFPPNLPLYNLDNLMVYILVAKHFNRDKYVIMGHSYGAQLGYFYSQMYPNKVEKLIMLDAITMWPIQSGISSKYVKHIYETFLKVDEKLKTNKPPVYTYEEALEKVATKRLYSELSLEAAKVILERNIKKIDDNKYIFTVDQRLKDYMAPLNDTRYKADSIIKNPVKCPVLMILATESTINKGSSSTLVLTKSKSPLYAYS
ncbi:unnamed protein product [Brassicogethes aeneus]|uniref:AB hydrolase-1 domain-containing protein n=1 Tax=Brassicogethes aeneus TaxID=1431903 RepID=A0A9P0BCD7_BRAAE|nr:unnamed protein product [Brassicogethes aeneus]